MSDEQETFEEVQASIEPIDFDQLLTGIAETRDYLGTIHKTMRGQKKEDFSRLLTIIDEHKDKLEVAFPDFRDRAAKDVEDLVERHKATVEKKKEIDEKLAELKAHLANKDKSPPAKPELQPVDTDLGKTLQDEILTRFVACPAPIDSDAEAGAWQDWNLQGNWTTGEFGSPDSTAKQ